MARPRKAMVEGQAVSTSAAQRESPSLGVVVDAFRERFPDEWGQVRTWPTESGIAHIIERMKG